MRLGLFGGTFAPPHLGHVRAAERYLDAVKPDKLIIMPTGIPPHKIKAKGDTPDARLEMCHAAFDQLENTEVSDYEIKKGGVSYSYLTLEHLTEPGREIDLLCGSDMFLTLSYWMRAEDIFRLARIVAFSRGTEDFRVLAEKQKEYETQYGARILLLDAEPFPVSSSLIREKIAGGEDLSGLLTEDVIRIIERENLYGKENENA